MKVIMEEVEVIEITSLVNRNSLYSFMRNFLYLLIPLRPNRFIKFRFVNVFKPLLINLFFMLKLSIWGNIFK